MPINDSNMEKKNSQRTRSGDCVALSSSDPGFYASLRRDTDDSCMKVPVGGNRGVVNISAGDYSLSNSIKLQ
jgi:hypothetical protein